MAALLAESVHHIDDGVARIAERSRDAAEPADAAVKTERHLEKAYRAAMGALAEPSSKRAESRRGGDDGQIAISRRLTDTAFRDSRTVVALRSVAGVPSRAARRVLAGSRPAHPQQLRMTDRRRGMRIRSCPQP